MTIRPTKKLGDKKYFTLIMGQSPDSVTYNRKGIGLPFFQGKKEFGEISPIVDQYCSLPGKIAEAGDILMSVRAPVGPTNLADQKCCIGRGLAAIRPNREECLIEYLLAYFKKFQSEISNLGKGSTFDAITKSDLENLEIPLPPLDIQKAIVTKLDEAFAEIDEAISLTEESIAKTEEFKKSVLDKVFEDGEWENKKMGDKKVLEIVDGDRGNNYPKKDEFLEDGYCLFLNTGNVRQGFFDLKDKQFITKEKDALLRKGKVKLDDVILTTRGTIGNSAHYDKNIEYTNVRINSGMVLLRSNKEVLMPEYLLKFITTPFFHKQRLAMASGSAQPQLPIGTLNNIEIPLPPLEDQAKIISYLDQVFAETSALKSDYETKLTHLKELKASILQSAFEGKLIAE